MKHADMSVSELEMAERELARDLAGTHSSRDAAYLYALLISVRMHLEAKRTQRAWWLDHV